MRSNKKHLLEKVVPTWLSSLLMRVLQVLPPRIGPSPRGVEGWPWHASLAAIAIVACAGAAIATMVGDGGCFKEGCSVNIASSSISRVATSQLRWSSTGVGHGNLIFKGYSGGAFLSMCSHGGADTVLRGGGGARGSCCGRV